MKSECSKCSQPLDRQGRYCRSCHAEYMREWRKTHPLSKDQRRRDNARSYAGIYLKRGKLTRQPCEVCNAKAQMHHDDYDRPLDVRWLCLEHHLALHAQAAKP